MKEKSSIATSSRKAWQVVYTQPQLPENKSSLKTLSLHWFVLLCIGNPGLKNKSPRSLIVRKTKCLFFIIFIEKKGKFMMKETQNLARVSLTEKLSTFGIVAFYYFVLFYFFLLFFSFDAAQQKNVVLQLFPVSLIKHYKADYSWLKWDSFCMQRKRFFIVIPFLWRFLSEMRFWSIFAERCVVCVHGTMARTFLGHFSNFKFSLSIWREIWCRFLNISKWIFVTCKIVWLEEILQHFLTSWIGCLLVFTL